MSGSEGTPERKPGEGRGWRAGVAGSHDPRRQGPYAARRSRTMGRCFRPVWKLNSSSTRAPGKPLTSVCGLAHGEPREFAARTAVPGSAADGDGSAWQKTDPYQRTTTYGLDSLLRTSSTTDENHDTTLTHHDALGRLDRLRDPVGNVTRFEYDDLDRLTDEITGLGIRHYEYDAAGNRTLARDRMFRERTFQVIGILISHSGDSQGGTAEGGAASRPPSAVPPYPVLEPLLPVLAAR